jgi:hypothetical protein
LRPHFGGFGYGDDDGQLRAKARLSFRSKSAFLKEGRRWPLFLRKLGAHGGCLSILR